MTKEDKIAAITKLMTDGILTAEEFTKIVQVLSGEPSAPAETEKSPAEQKYEDYFRNHIAYGFKSPASIQFPPLVSSMIQEGELSILDGMKYRPMRVRFILTYVDAPNSYGTMLRQELAIIVDDEFNPQFAVQRVKGLLGGVSNNWMKMPGVK